MECLKYSVMNLFQVRFYVLNLVWAYHGSAERGSWGKLSFYEKSWN